jgi:hypothetical protein
MYIKSIFLFEKYLRRKFNAYQEIDDISNDGLTLLSWSGAVRESAYQ